jgi:hypothetical protein
MNSKNNYIGRCFCGDVKFTLNSEPEAMAYCHCNSCRHWSAGPVSAFTLWKPDTVHITHGEDNIGTFSKNPSMNDETVYSIRKWCKTCGGHIFTEHPTMGLIDVPAAVIADFNFTPGFHVHYQETVHHMMDGLPKMQDLPKEAGGSGIELAE